MTYNFNPYTSVYRDPKTVEINTLLRERFQNNFAEDDAIARAADAMDAADFDGDQERMLELQNATRKELEERSARGDYENMGMAVAKSARDFEKGYAPIKKNHETFAAYQASLKKQYDEGHIDAEAYKKSMAYSTHEYNGLQLDEEGNIDEESFFNGYDPVKSVEVQKEFDEAMESYTVREGGREWNVVKEGATYKYYNGHEWKGVDPNEVQRIFNEVIQRPDVVASIAQKAKFRTFDIDDSSIQESITQDIYGDPNNPEDTGLVGMRAEIEKMEAKGAKEILEKEQALAGIDGSIAQREGLLNGTEQERRQFLESNSYNSQVNREWDAASAKHIYMNEWTKEETEFSETYLIDLKSKVDAYTVPVFTKTGMLQRNNVGGDSPAAIQGYIKDQKDLEQGIAVNLTKEARRGNYIGNDVVYTVEDIMNGNVAEELKGENGKLEVAQRSIAEARENSYNQQRRLDLAKEETGYTKAVSIEGESYDINIGGWNNSIEMEGDDFLQYGRDYFEDPDMSSTELISRLKNNRQIDNIADDAGVGPQTELVFGAQSQRFFEYVSEESGNTVEGVDKLASSLIFRTDKKISDADDKLESYIKKNSTIEFGGMTTSVFAEELDGGLDQPITKAVKAEFENKPFPPNLQIYYNGRQDANGTIETMIADMGLVVPNGINVKTVKFDASPYTGDNTLTFVTDAKDKSGKNVEVTVPYAGNMQVLGLDEHYNQPLNRTAKSVNRAAGNNLPNTDIGFFDDNGNYRGHHRYHFDKDGNTTSIEVFQMGNNEIPVIIKTLAPGSTSVIDAGTVNERRVNTLESQILQASASGLQFRTMTDYDRPWITN